VSDEKNTFNVASYGDHGIAIGQLKITAAQAELKVTELFRYQPSAEGFHTRVAFHLDAPYAAETLYVRADALSIQRMTLVPQQGMRGGHRETPSDAEPGVLYATVPKPGVDYVADILTREATGLSVRGALNEQHVSLPNAGDVLWSIGG
jgi:hypothetical protein